MPGLLAVLEATLAPVFRSMHPEGVPALRPSQRADFQANGALALARLVGRPPRDVAAEVLERAMQTGLADICEKVEVAGPGFLNMWVSADAMAKMMANVRPGLAGLGVPVADPVLRVVVDYGGPNAAKQMHVGHLRSTIIGDAIVRLLEAVGHRVVRENHIGDWGANFGMLVEHLVDVGEDAADAQLALGDLEAFYQAARSSYQEDPEFAERSRRRVVLLQSGDPATLRLWRLIVSRSLEHFDTTFRRMGVRLGKDDVVGESFYNPLLPVVIEELAKAGLLVESDGARCVFPPGHTNREGHPLPLIVQNSVGGFTYATTDLAAVKDRTGRLGAQLLVYVVGLPQSEHLEMVFAVAHQMGWLGDGREAVHVGFGNVLGPDGKMFRTRQGGTVKLDELLDEAEARARAVVSARVAPADEPDGLDLDAVARAVGIGAVKYADLSTDRARDYRFDWERMLSLDGNTAPYIQYAHARCSSIMRRASAEGIIDIAGPEASGAGDLRSSSGDQSLFSVALGGFVALIEPEEKELAKRLLCFGDAVVSALDGFSPHKLCTYLFELALTFTTFYEKCSVLRAPGANVRRSRLALCALTGEILRRGLDLLGIEAPERM